MGSSRGASKETTSAHRTPATGRRAHNPPVRGMGGGKRAPYAEGMLRWTALLVCLICACAFGAADASTSTLARRSAGSAPKLSCLWFKGKRKWCLAPWNDGYCEVETYFGRDWRNRLIVYNQKEEILGYLRPNGPGTWRAMVLTWRGWARDGRVAARHAAGTSCSAAA
jgi:hypothetical protein